jgi:PII-like signaling protein
MQIPNQASLLRIFIGESDRWEHKPLYEAIVLAARGAKLAGATVLRGPMGYGKSSRLHTTKILQLSMDLPLVIEIVDTEEKINAFLPLLNPMMGGGLVTLEKVRVIHYRSGVDDLSDRLMRLVHAGGNREIVLAGVLDALLDHFHSETGAIHRLAADQQVLHLLAQKGLPPQLLDVVKTIPVGKGIAGQVIAQGRPVTLCNLQTDTSGVARPGARQTGVGGALCVPLRQDGNLVGTLGIGTKREYEYTPEETARLEEAGNLIAPLCLE